MEGLQAIGIDQILAYCVLDSIAPGESAKKFLRIMQRLDNARIKHWNMKNASK